MKRKLEEEALERAAALELKENKKFKHLIRETSNEVLYAVDNENKALLKAACEHMIEMREKSLIPKMGLEAINAALSF